MSICSQGYAHWHLTWLVLRKWLGTIKSYCHSSTEIFNLLTRDKQLKLTESLCDNEYIHIPLVNFLLMTKRRKMEMHNMQIWEGEKTP